MRKQGGAASAEEGCFRGGGGAAEEGCFRGGGGAAEAGSKPAIRGRRTQSKQSGRCPCMRVDQFAIPHAANLRCRTCPRLQARAAPERQALEYGEIGVAHSRSA